MRGSTISGTALYEQDHGAAVPASAGAVLAATRDAEQTCQLAQETSKLLDDLRGRLLGSWPEAEANTAQLRSASSGELGGLNEQLGSLRAVVVDMQHTVRTLNSSL